VNPSPLEAILNHEGRLDLLCCLLDCEPLAVPQLSARVGRSLSEVGYHIRLLESHDLVEQTGGLDEGNPLYAATVDRHPEWVREAVEAHHRG
jgi:DNA-binding transcriptional ArsR family regulator